MSGPQRTYRHITRLTVEGCAPPFDCHPSFFGDWLVNDSKDWHAIAQQSNKGAKDRLACTPQKSSSFSPDQEGLCLRLCHPIMSSLSVCKIRRFSLYVFVHNGFSYKQLALVTSSQ